MINPNKITNFNLTRFELEEHLAFWLLVAGKTATVTAKNLDKFLKTLLVYAWEYEKSFDKNSPFELINRFSINELSTILKNCGFGCYNIKAKGLKQLASSGLNLYQCTTDDLEKINCIGRKTSRCFIMHTRKYARCAGLDTHLLRFLKDLGYEVPESTPGSGRLYKKIENQYLTLVDKTKLSSAELDLLIWRVYSKHPHLKRILIKYFTKSPKQC